MTTAKAKHPCIRDILAGIDRAEQVVRLRKAVNLSLKAFGKRLDVRWGTVWRWEKGVREPDKKKMQRMIDVFSPDLPAPKQEGT